MSAWSDRFNEMPYVYRNIAAMSGAETHIKHLECEKKRLKDRYLQSVNEINAQIKNIQQWIDRASQEQA